MIGTCLEGQKIDGAQACLESLIELAENEPKFFRTVLRDLVAHMTRVREGGREYVRVFGHALPLALALVFNPPPTPQLASNAELDDGCRNLAMEVLVVLCEAGAGMVRKMPDFVPTVVPTCLKV